MKLGLLKLIFRFYILVLLLFFYRNAQFWQNTITYRMSVSDPLINISILALIVLGFVVILDNIKFITFRGIHLIALLWILGMLLVFIYNGGSWVICLRCILWPVLFETIYIFTLRIYGVDDCAKT